MTIKFNKDEDLGHIYRVPCLECTGKTDHSIVSSYQLQGDKEYGNFSFSWTENYQIIQCLGCKALSFRLSKTNSEDYAEDQDGELFEVEEESLYPARLEGIKHLKADLIYLPHQIRSIYEETIKALANQQPILTGIGLRALIESLCKDNNAEGKTLLTKIDDLVKLQVLTPADASILHSIRTLGNNAAHEAMPHRESQLQLAMTIVENLLRSVYILPLKVQASLPSK